MTRLETLRERVKDAHLAYLFAQAHVKEIQEERAKWGELPIPDGTYQYQQAVAWETITLRRYRERVQELSEALRHAASGT